MAYQVDLQTLPADAAADLSAYRYCAVRLSAANNVNVASLNTSRTLFGVLQNIPESGQRATVAYGGVSKVRVGAAVTAGDIITHNSSGRIITKPASGTYVCLGVALETAGAAEQYISARLFPTIVELTD